MVSAAGRGLYRVRPRRAATTGDQWKCVGRCFGNERAHVGEAGVSVSDLRNDKMGHSADEPDSRKIESCAQELMVKRGPRFAAFSIRRRSRSMDPIAGLGRLGR